MDNFSTILNDLLTGTFRSILKLEEAAIRRVGLTDLSISELHLIESVGKNKEDGMTIGEIAEDQDITGPSVTVAINKLERKGYVTKARNAVDGRKIHVKLTKLGSKINAGHQYFHENMCRNVAKNMTEEERKILIRGISHLNDFFLKKVDEMDSQGFHLKERMT